MSKVIFVLQITHFYNILHGYNHEEVLLGVNEQRNILPEIRKRNAHLT